MKGKLLLLIAFLAVCCVVSFTSFTGCDKDDDHTGPKATKTPTPPPGPTATPSPIPPTPNNGNTFISGKAVVNVTGATIAPSDDYDKGTIFSVDGNHCEVIWVRLRNRGGVAYYQLKGTADNGSADACWGELNYYSMLQAADGDWVMTWGTSGNSTWVKVEVPNGTSEQISIPNYMGLNHVTTFTTSCIRPPVPGSTTSVAISFEGYDQGSTTRCPY